MRSNPWIWRSSDLRTSHFDMGPPPDLLRGPPHPDLGTPSYRGPHMVHHMDMGWAPIWRPLLGPHMTHLACRTRSQYGPLQTISDTIWTPSGRSWGMTPYGHGVASHLETPFRTLFDTIWPVGPGPNRDPSRPLVAIGTPRGLDPQMTPLNVTI